MSLDDQRLSATAREALSDVGNELFLSPASYWEIAIKASIGKYNLTEPLSELVAREIAANGLRVLPIHVEHAAKVVSLPFHHKDPFDRILIAQSIVENMPILGCDTVFDQYDVERIWT